MKADTHTYRGNARTTLFVLYAVLILYAVVTLMPFVWMLVTSF